MTAEQLPGKPDQQLPAHDPQLTLAGLSRDRSQLLLVSRSGARFTLPVDSRLSAALRGDTSTIGQLEISMDSTIRPRDIQARIRSGETPESVAKAASTSLEKIMPYAAPVLAEREHITLRAQKSSLRRTGHAARTLGDAVGEHLRGLDVDPGLVTWDAWRREDGRWTVVADTTATDTGTAGASGGRAGTATFTFDAPGNFVVLEDDHAHWLVGAEQAPEPAPEQPAADQAAAPARSLSSVPAQETWEQPVEAFLDERPGLDETEQRELAADAAALDDGSPADALADPRADPRDIARDLARDDVPAAAAGDDEPPARRPARKKGGRSSVPSWDEIMFGGGKND